MEFLLGPDLDVYLRLVVATVLGMLLGLERNIAGKTAGMRTYALVSLGACLFVLVSILVIAEYGPVFSFDPLRVTAGIVTGIGFLCAGVIIFRNSELSGLTTAAGMWVSAGIGIASGFGLFGIAFAAAVLTLLIFTALWFLEHRVVNTVKDFKKD